MSSWACRREAHELEFAKARMRDARVCSRGQQIGRGENCFRETGFTVFLLQLSCIDGVCGSQ
jgi:hypothetical protein